MIVDAKTICHFIISAKVALSSATIHCVYERFFRLFSVRFLWRVYFTHFEMADSVPKQYRRLCPHSMAWAAMKIKCQLQLGMGFRLLLPAFSYGSPNWCEHIMFSIHTLYNNDIYRKMWNTFWKIVLTYIWFFFLFLCHSVAVFTFITMPLICSPNGNTNIRGFGKQGFQCQGKFAYNLINDASIYCGAVSPPQTQANT